MAIMESALAEFEQQLRTNGYRQLEPFFLLKEGEIYDERDGGIQKITKTRLEKIARTQNERTVDSGDATPVIIGHTKRHLPEKEQPQIVGLVPRWEVTKFFNTNKWGLRGIPWAKPDSVKLSEKETITCEEAFKRFPRRSAEFWTNPDVLDPISILGANTPRLDLGLHQLQQDRLSIQLSGSYRLRKPIYLEMDMPNDTPGAPNALDTSAPMSPEAGAGADVLNSDRFKAVEACCTEFKDMMGLLKPFLDELRQAQSPMGDMGMGGAPMGGPPMGMDGPAGAPPGMGGAPPANAAPAPPPPSGGGGGGSKDEDDDDDEPVRASAAIPSWGNTMLPQQLDNQSGRRGQPTNTPDPRDAVIQQLQYQVASLQLQRIEDTVNTRLDEMEEKIVFDRGREFKRLVKLSREEFDAEVAYMINTYKPKDEPLPAVGVPLQMQATRPNDPQYGGPITLQQARSMVGTGADPSMQVSAQQTTYDKLVNIVRNRGKNGKPLMDAFNEVMGKSQGTGDVTPTR